VKHVAPFLFWFAALWWFWMLLVGEWNRQEWIAAACVAGVTAFVGELARTRAEAHPNEGIGRVLDLYMVVPLVVVDFALLMWALLRALVTRRIPDGSFRECEATDPWTAVLATFSPNAYVIGENELHRLLPFERSEEPA
jgi:hypothetical protein